MCVCVYDIYDRLEISSKLVREQRNTQAAVRIQHALRLYHTHTHTRSYIHTQVINQCDSDIHVCICIYIHIYIHRCEICVSVHTYTPICMYADIHAYIHTYMHTYMYVCVGYTSKRHDSCPIYEA